MTFFEDYEKYAYSPRGICVSSYYFDSEGMQELQFGFIGLGVMGHAIALNPARAGTRLRIWNCSPERYDELLVAGATVAASPNEVFANTQLVIRLLANEGAIDSVLEHNTADCPRRAPGPRSVCATGCVFVAVCRNRGSGPGAQR